MRNLGPFLLLPSVYIRPLVVRRGAVDDFPSVIKSLSEESANIISTPLSFRF